MFFFFPIGHEESAVRRFPYVTIALIVLCVLVFAGTQAIMVRQVRQERQLDEQLEHLKVQVYLQYHEKKKDGLVTALIDKDAGNWNEVYRKLGKNIEDYWQAFAAGKAVPADDPLFARFQELARLKVEMQERFLLQRYGLIPARPTPVAVITSMFMHGSLSHLIFNLLFLFLVGFALEGVWGPAMFTGVYLLAGIAGGLTHVLMHPGMNVPVIGASGAVAGLMGAFLFRFYRIKINFAYFIWLYWHVRMGTKMLPSLVVLPLWLFIQIFYVALGAEDVHRVAYWAHIGGFAFGLLAAVALRIVGFGDKTIREEDEEDLEKFKRGEYIPLTRPPDFGEPTGPLSAAQRLEVLRGLLDRGEHVAAKAEADDFMRYLVEVDNPRLAAEVLMETDAMVADYQPPATTLLRLAQFYKDNWNNERAVALYERAAGQAGPQAVKALLEAARLRAKRLKDPAGAHALYQRLLQNLPPADPVVEIVKQEMGEG
ncbi:MAG TPA: rhomboid family intramembrane serine protease [bacterium]|nr:rhomboid family intramembrane serine protease [bacterium]